MTFQINTLRLDSTHLDTYNLVGFGGCLHLWWIPLLTPELCVTSVTMNQFPSHTRLALNEFQASYYSHHKSQSTLSETNWLLRVPGCNPYLESLPSYIVGAPPWTPTNRGHGITSRPLKHDPGISHRDFKELHTNHKPNIIKQLINNYRAYIHTYMSTLITNLFHIPGQTNTISSCSIHELESWSISLPCHFRNQPFHTNFMPRIYSSLSFRTHTPSHSCILYPSCHYTITPSITCQTLKGREGNTKLERTLAQLVAQAERISLRREGLSLGRAPLHLGESSIKLGKIKHASSLRRALLTWARQSLAQNQNHPPRWQLAEKAWASLHQTRLGESDSPGRDY